MFEMVKNLKNDLLISKNSDLIFNKMELSKECYFCKKNKQFFLNNKSDKIEIDLKK
jgi:hypothetical protein